MVAICFELLCGQYAATSADRTRCDWPASPQRLFLALIATAHHAGIRDRCDAVLRWLESLPDPPEIYCGAVNELQLARRTGVFVPGNYMLKEEAREQQGWIIGRKELDTFAVTPSDPRLVFAWPSQSVPSAIEPVLRDLLAHVSFLGRSESQVRAYVCLKDDELPALPVKFSAAEPATVPLRHLAGLYPGMLDDVEDHWKRETASYEARLHREAAKMTKPTRKARASSRKAESACRELPGAPDEEVHPFPEQLPIMYSQVESGKVLAPRKADSASHISWLRTVRQVNGRSIPLGFAPLLAEDIRHQLVGRLKGGLMVVPLPFVGHPHADSAVKGVTFWLDLQNPGALPDHELIDHAGAFNAAQLPNGRHEFDGEETSIPSLSQWRWGGPSRTWTSVTPVLLPRFPDKRRLAEDVGTSLRECCRYIGLQEPFEFEFDRNAAISGVPPVRRFRLPQRYEDRAGFHVVLRFENPVRGPLVLGVGRYLGIGLCIPVRVSGA